MSDSLEQLQIDARDIIDRGMAPDRIVLRAIGLGCDTRRALKDATGLDYASIEKALEREAGAIHKSTKGMIERLTIADGHNNGNGNHHPAPPVRQPPVNESLLTCAQCGKPRALGSGRLCRSCYQAKTLTPEQRVQAGEMRAQGKSMAQIASTLGMSTPTFNKRRKDDPSLEEALERGWDAYLQSDEDEPEVAAPVGYIEEKVDAPMKIGISDDSLQHRVAKMLLVQDLDSPVLRNAIQLIEQETTEKIMANRPPHQLADFSNLPSAVIKEIRNDDAYFSNAYETLIGILDWEMDGDEKSAIWMIILYLKAIEKQRWNPS